MDPRSTEMPDLRTKAWLCVSLAHLLLYIVVVHFKVLGTGLFWEISYWICFAPWALYAVIRLPVMAPVEIAIFLPVIRPNEFGLFLTVLTWLLIHWLLAGFLANRLESRNRRFAR